MPNPIVLGTPATCTDTATATSTVRVGEISVSKVGLDTAVGLIDGPGSEPFKVFVEGVPMSLVGDTIKSHGDTPHATASFLNPLESSKSVFIGGL